MTGVEDCHAAGIPWNAQGGSEGGAEEACFAFAPLADRVSASEVYVARKKKRLEEAEQEILEAIKRRDVLKAEVVAGEERLAGLKAELTRAAPAPPQVPPMLVFPTRLPI